MRWIRLVCRDVQLSLSSTCTLTPRLCASISASAMSLRSLEYAAIRIVEPRCAWFTAAMNVVTSRSFDEVLAPRVVEVRARVRLPRGSRARGGGRS